MTTARALHNNEDFDIEDILNKPYWSFEAIITLAISKSANYINTAGTSSPNSSDLQNTLSFKLDLLKSLINAIDNRQVMPVNLAIQTSHPDDFRQHLSSIKLPGFIILATLLMYALQYLSQKPDVKAAIAKGGGHGDLNKLFFNIYEVFIALPAAISAIIGIIGLIAALRMSYKIRRDNSTEGKLKYYMTQAHNSGYTETLYERDSVIRFLNSKYSFDLEVKNRTKSDVSSENAKADRINKKVQSVADNFIDQELAKGCTCLHSDLSRYIAPLALKASLSKIKESRSYARRTDDDLLNDSELKTKVDGWCEEATTRFFKFSEKYPDAKARIKGSWEDYRQPPPCKVHGK